MKVCSEMQRRIFEDPFLQQKIPLEIAAETQYLVARMGRKKGEPACAGSPALRNYAAQVIGSSNTVRFDLMYLHILYQFRNLQVFTGLSQWFIDFVRR